MLIKSKIINDAILYVKELIPENCGGNIDKNIKTLKIYLYENKEGCTGEYSQIGNYINLSLKGMSNESYSNNYDYFNYLNYSIRYLLLNVASTKFDKENNIVYSGFSTINFNNEMGDDLHTGLDRGFMSLLLKSDATENIKFSKIYYSIAGMLTEIVGIDIMKDAFFNNKGITPMIDKLSWLGINKDESKKLFKDINKLKDAFSGKYINEKLPVIQRTLVSFFSNKVEKSESKDVLIKEKNSFIYFLDDNIKTGNFLIHDLYEDTSTYDSETKAIKELARTM
ncbi:MAG: hypothetical protein GX032_02365 [Tenericutes bacterium]|nr:hypothetical protein [Mycoplasmatota bacterium]